MLADGVGGKGRESCLIALSAALIVFSPRSGSLNRRTTVNERVYKTPRRVRELAKIPVRTEIVYAMRKRFGVTGHPEVILMDAVGTIITDRPPHRSLHALLHIPLPPYMGA